jgi:myo-inositol-1(or 4)-monophosphatase
MCEQVLEVAIEAAKEAGRLLRAGMVANKEARCKSHRHDPVTLFDRRAEEVIVAAIERSFPEHGFLSEEGTARQIGSSYCWVIDPLDGTNNFLRGYPQFAVSLALMEEEIPLVACIYDPLREELFTAIRGKGASLNGRQVQVSPQGTLDGALIGAGFSSRPERALVTCANLERLIPHARAIRAAGSACLDLAYVAAGRLDATWYIALSPWDVAAGILLVEEAGGHVTNLSGEPLVDPEAGVLATNGRIHAELLAILWMG